MMGIVQQDHALAITEREAVQHDVPLPAQVEGILAGRAVVGFGQGGEHGRAWLWGSERDRPGGRAGCAQAHTLRVGAGHHYDGGTGRSGVCGPSDCPEGVPERRAVRLIVTGRGDEVLGGGKRSCTCRPQQCCGCHELVDHAHAPCPGLQIPPVWQDAFGPCPSPDALLGQASAG